MFHTHWLDTLNYHIIVFLDSHNGWDDGNAQY